MYESVNDGVDHINIYSKGKTTLGRCLSNFANLGVDFALGDLEEFADYGKFATLEGLWYYLKLEYLLESGVMPYSQERVVTKKFREMTSGSDIKKIGKDIFAKYQHHLPEQNEFLKLVHHHEEVMKYAYWLKISQNPIVAELLKESGDITLTHYYVGKGNRTILCHDTLSGVYMQYRKEIINGTLNVPSIIQ